MVAGHEVASLIHIHNGDVVAAMARRSDIPGEHVAYRESLVTGPVVPGDAWIETRARALSERYGEDILRTRTALLEQEQLLDSAHEKGEIVLWFEHDLYCLIHLVHLLQRLSSSDARVSLVFCPTPLGEQDERALHLLFESRAAVTPAMQKIAREAWAAYTSSDPTELNRFLDRDLADFPFLREGLALHVSRFPSTRNGIGAIEQRALEAIAAGATEFIAIFDAINVALPRLGFGDTEIFQILQGIAWNAAPLVTLTGDVPKAIFSITPVGETILRGAADNLAVNDPDAWFGGAHLTKENVWRFDGTRLSPSRVF
jgi:hypothetical protein